MNRYIARCLSEMAPPKPSKKGKYVAIGVTCAAVAAVAFVGYYFLRKKDITIKLCCDIDSDDEYADDDDEGCCCEDTCCDQKDYTACMEEEKRGNASDAPTEA